MKKFDSINLNALLKILLLFGFAAFFIVSIVSGTVSLYVHPRVIPFMIFAAAAMIIIAILLFRDLFKSVGKKVSSWPLLLFLFPLIMAFALPAESFDAGSETAGELQLSASNNYFDSSVNSGQAADDAVSSSAPESETADAGEADEADDGGLLQDGSLVLDSVNYYQRLCEIYGDIDKYKGTSVTLEGFVFRDSERFGENMFVPARLLMVCCAADMQTVGLLCVYDEAAELSEDSWVTVKGTINETELDGEMVPCIMSESVEVTDEPTETYIYPY